MEDGAGRFARDPGMLTRLARGWETFFTTENTEDTEVMKTGFVSGLISFTKDRIKGRQGVFALRHRRAGMPDTFIPRFGRRVN